ncbi:MAG: hypothetical protein OXK82_06720 [Deltaproteobacteria bacterium]|nr:hypothetical protein [Deltaproteobacteria bacterium]
MQLTRLRVLYGVLGEGSESVPRDPSGYLGIEQGIYRRHGLDLSWDHVQGTEERNQALADGDADLSLVIGRASLQHFLRTGTTRLIGSCMNSSPYVLMVPAGTRELARLEGKVLACRRVIAETAPLAETFRNVGRLELGTDLGLDTVDTDQHALDRLTEGSAGAALLPRPFDFVARERGFQPLAGWPVVADDPMPITVETMAARLNEKGGIMAAFLAAHREAIRYLQGHRNETLAMLDRVFGYAPDLAAVLYDEYLGLLDPRLTVDLPQVEKLVRLTAPDAGVGLPELASRWLAPGAVSPEAPVAGA